MLTGLGVGVMGVDGDAGKQAQPDVQSGSSCVERQAVGLQSSQLRQIVDDDRLEVRLSQSPQLRIRGGDHTGPAGPHHRAGLAGRLPPLGRHAPYARILRAGTTTSPLKNTPRDITLDKGKEKVPTGRRRHGSLIGDHTKTAVLTRLMTGTYVGFCSMIAVSGLPPHFVPSFSFVTDTGVEPYRMDKAVKVMKAAYARRDLSWTPADDRILEHVMASIPQVER